MEYLAYGSPTGADQEQAAAGCQIVATYGTVELEYAAIRRGVGLFDSPHRGTLRVTGKDRIDFLNRLLTNDLGAISHRPSAIGSTDSRQPTAESGQPRPPGGGPVRAFWLNRKGRIEADLTLIELGEQMLIDLDVHQAARTAETLSNFLFSEDVKIEDVSSQCHHIALHGPKAADYLASVTRPSCEPGDQRVFTASIADVPVVAFRKDDTGETGYELIVPREDAAVVWTALQPALPLAPGSPGGSAPSPLFIRPIGWYAYNIARIEAGTPLFNIDFNATNLPHETGILDERVSFKKGCYIGQEIVARMQHLGKPKKILVGLKVQEDRLPSAGDKVYARLDDGAAGEEVGLITSSTLSPMLGASPIALAMIRQAHAALDNVVLVNAEGAVAPAIVSPLRFWPQEGQTKN